MRKVLLASLCTLSLAGCSVQLPFMNQESASGTTVGESSENQVVWVVSDMDINGWKNYRNDQDYYRLSYPPSFNLQRTASGITLTGSDGLINIVMRHQTNLQEMLAQYFSKKILTTQWARFQFNLRSSTTAAVILSVASDEISRHDRIYLMTRNADSGKNRHKRYDVIIAQAVGYLTSTAQDSPTKDLDKILTVPEQVLSTLDFIPLPSSSSSTSLQKSTDSSSADSTTSEDIAPDNAATDTGASDSSSPDNPAPDNPPADNTPLE